MADRDIELIFIQFKDESFSYSVELGSGHETVDDIKEKLRKEYPNGRHLKPQEIFVYKNQELKDGHLLAEYHVVKDALLYVAVSSCPKKEAEEVSVTQSVKHKHLLPSVDLLTNLLTRDEPFYDNPFIKRGEVDVFHPKFHPIITESQRVASRNGGEDEEMRVRNKRGRMSIGKVLPWDVEPDKKRAFV